MNKFLSVQRLVLYNEQVISYELVRKNVKNINLRIRADGSITISANSNVPDNVIDEFVFKKADYIIANINRFSELKQYAPAPKKYVSGESFYLMGKNLRLKVIEDVNEDVFSDGVYLYLKVKDKENFTKKEKMITQYFDKQCKECFGEIVTQMLFIFSKYGIALPILKIRNMETRWGSCLPKKGIITLNKPLIEAPRNCIEYVVLHEYCHFIHPNHSKQFYAFVSMLMPDWKERKKVLESIENRSC
ncbi:hypothetical protein SDC9_126904 [bioreactor metagenome]|uniref:YgjP-like metallopeptidase domain-containing protein n=1 Tax=bioreactor metagenome TaxID=1076179 RepID=A0A645CT37_9ZZZZ